MKQILFLIFCMAIYLNSKADTLLVPDNTITLTDYNSKCVATGYICTQDYFFEKEMQKPTPHFDSFLETVDLSSKSFIESAPKQIQNLLKAEMISASQLDMLARLLEQMQSSNINKNQQLLSEIKFIQLNLVSDKSNILHEDEFVIFFKTAISKNKFDKIKRSYLNLPITEIRFNQIPDHHTLLSIATLANNNNFLVEGICEKEKLHSDLNIHSWKVLSEASCGWSQSVAKSSTTVFSTIKENKGWVAVGILAVGAIMLSNRYEVSLQF